VWTTHKQQAKGSVSMKAFRDMPGSLEGWHLGVDKVANCLCLTEAAHTVARITHMCTHASSRACPIGNCQPMPVWGCAQVTG
jgi:hypothetical protein